ncbi:MAG: molybdenum cofactor biosynthesis protein MoaE [Ignavibacteriae bacterium]|nr:molybdenum cofactor biosynthesis protein MoaE [Ignavibacteriota bacterium]
MINIVQHSINIQEVIASVSDAGAGGIDVFIGTTRDNAKGKRVLWLEYEAYEPMALKTMQQIVDEANGQWKLKKVSAVHRIGRVDIGEASVVIAVSSAHRKEAFEACRFLIDRLKQIVPIWKKEFFEDGSVWVDSRINNLKE